jgi:predicted Mrr-cat superfamily restriction endonuclease
VHAELFERCDLIAIALAGVSEDVSAWPRDELIQRVVAALDEPRERAHAYASMLVRFVYEMQIGDVVVMPDSSAGEVIVGEVAGTYAHLRQPPVAGFDHSRRMKWRRRIVWRELPLQVRRSISAPMAVFKPAAQEAVLASMEPAVRL